MREWSFVIVAAGKGRRFGGPPKQFEKLGEMPLWEWSARTALKLKADGVEQIVLVVPPGMESSMEAETALIRSRIDLVMVPGGERRQDSVLNGLKAARGKRVMIHDSARPFVSPMLCRRLVCEAVKRGSAVPLLPVTDALKHADQGVIVAGIPREGLLVTQTPQAFPSEEIHRVLKETPGHFSDEAEAWLASGRDLGWTRGDPLNFKITFPEDMELASRVLRGSSVERTGFGFDVHRLSPGIPLFLGGLRIPFPLGLSGHSDGDLLCHAIADAVLGAAGLPDIGTLFPASEGRFKGIRSLDILKEAVAMTREKGFTVSSVNAVVNAQVPRLASMAEGIRKNLTEVLFADRPGTVSLTFKSGEWTGDVGNGEAMRCWAVARLVTEGDPWHVHPIETSDA